MKKFLMGLSLATAISFCDVAQADVVGVGAPGWNRNGPQSGFAIFDVFEESGAGGGIIDPTAPNSPTTGAAGGNGVTGTVSQAAGLGFPGGVYGGAAPADNRVYVHESAYAWSMVLNSANFDVNYLSLNIKERDGTGLVSSTVLLNGLAADSFSFGIFDDGDGPDVINTYFWDVSGSTITQGDDFTVSVSGGPFSFYSFDSFFVDVSAVPEPSGIVVATLAFTGLLLRRRR